MNTTTVPLDSTIGEILALVAAVAVIVVCSIVWGKLNSRHKKKN